MYINKKTIEHYFFLFTFKSTPYETNLEFNNFNVNYNDFYDKSLHLASRRILTGVDGEIEYHFSP